MPLVQAGKTFTGPDLKKTAGELAAHLLNNFQQAEAFRAQLATFVDADVVALGGITQPELDAIKGFFVGDIPGMRTTFLASAWLRRLLGLGVS